MSKLKGQIKFKIQSPKFKLLFDICHLDFGIDLTFVIWTLALLLLTAIPVRSASVLPPNDPYYELYQKDYFEQARIPEAWQITTGSPDVIIAVIDSGVDIDHPDIMGNMWFNPGEIAGNGLDDDDNGYIDDLNGWDFVADVSDPHPKLTGDFDIEGSQHGTAVAGIAAAASNNGEGLAGVCQQCKIMALRTHDSLGISGVENVANAVRYAVRNGAQIINFSIIREVFDRITFEALTEAYQAGVTIVAAAGNNAINDTSLGGDLASSPLYPICFDGGVGQNQVLGVGSLDRQNRKSSFSDYGAVCLDINAPGQDMAAAKLYDPKAGDEFTEKYAVDWSGTSLAAPIVAGAVGLMKSVNPRLSPRQVIDIIRQTGKNIDNLNPSLASQLGAGLIDAGAAVKLAKETVGKLPEKSEPQKEKSKQEPLAERQIAAKRRQIIVGPGVSRPAMVQSMDKDGAVKNKWLAFPAFFRGGANIARGDIDGDGEDETIVAAGAGGGPQVRVFTQEGELVTQFFAYNKEYRNGVIVAAVDVNRDGADDIIAAAGDKNSSLLNILFSNNEKNRSFRVSASGADGPVNLAAADLDKDGEIEIIAGAASGALPEIQIFDTVGKKKGGWLAFAKSFRGGVKVAVGDADGDGQVEIVAGPASKGGPQARVFNPDGKLKYQFFAFDKSLRAGLSVAVGNVDDDPQLEIIVGAGPGARGAVSVFGKFGADFSQEATFNVFEDKFRGGVNVTI